MTTQDTIQYTILYCIEALPFVMSLIYWHKIKETYYKWFAPYLFYIFATDIIGTILDQNKIPNQVYYDYAVMPVEYLFFYWLFHKTLANTPYSKTPIICTVIYVVSFIIENLFFTHQFNSVSSSIGDLLLLILIVQFFVLLSKNDAILNYRQNMMFWISIGLLLFYIGTISYYGLRNTLLEEKKDDFLTWYGTVCDIISEITYILFSISFIWGKPQFSQLSST